MANGHGRDSNKMSRQRNCQKYSGRTARESLQYYVSQDVKRKNTAVKHGYNSDVDKQKGIDWFNSGLALEEAPDEMKNNASFIVGYNRAYRAKLINENLYDLGIEYFLRGVSLEDIPERYRNNEYFIKGYNSKNKIR